MNWIIYAILSVVFFTALNITQRIAAVDSSHHRTTAVLFNLMAIAMAFLLFFISGSYKDFHLPHNYYAWIFVGFAMLFYGLYERGRFYIAEKLDASTFTIVSNISVIIAFVGSLFLYSERLSIINLLGAALIIVSIYIVGENHHRKKVSSTKNILLGVLISTFLGLGWMLDKKGTLYFGVNSYNILLWTLPIFVLIFPLVKIKTLWQELKTAFWKIFFPAFFNFAGYWCGLMAFSLTKATYVIPITQMSTPMTVLVGIFLLKERDHIPKKIIAGILAFVGAYLLVAVV